MVFVWSYLTDGDPVYTLVQVAVNDLIMLVAFAPIVMFLCGVANVVVPVESAHYVRRGIHRDSAGGRLADAHGVAEIAWQGMVRTKLSAEISSGDDRRAAADAGADFCVPSREPHHALACGAAARRADRHPGLFQLRR